MADLGMRGLFLADSSLDAVVAAAAAPEAADGFLGSGVAEVLADSAADEVAGSFVCIKQTM